MKYGQFYVSFLSILLSFLVSSCISQEKTENDEPIENEKEPTFLSKNDLEISLRKKQVDMNIYFYITIRNNTKLLVRPQRFTVNLVIQSARDIREGNGVIKCGRTLPYSAEICIYPGMQHVREVVVAKSEGPFIGPYDLWVEINLADVNRRFFQIRSNVVSFRFE